MHDNNQSGAIDPRYDNIQRYSAVIYHLLQDNNFDAHLIIEPLARLFVEKDERIATLEQALLTEKRWHATKLFP